MPLPTNMDVHFFRCQDGRWGARASYRQPMAGAPLGVERQMVAKARTHQLALERLLAWMGPEYERKIYP